MLEGTSGGPSCTPAPSRASCEVRPDCSGLCPARSRNPQGWSLPNLPEQPVPLPAPWPACPHGGKVSVPRLNPSRFSSCLLYLVVLPHMAVKGPAALSPSPPHRHRGGCKVPPKPPLPQAGQVPLPQPLLMGQCSSPERRRSELTPGYRCLSALGGTKLATVPRCGLTTSAGQRGQPLPRHPHCAPADAAMLMVLVISVARACYQLLPSSLPQSPFLRAAPQTVCPQPVSLQETLPSQVQHFAFDFLNFMRFLLAHPSSLSRSL